MSCGGTTGFPDGRGFFGGGSHVKAEMKSIGLQCFGWSALVCSWIMGFGTEVDGRLSCWVKFVVIFLIFSSMISSCC